jgi:hypothetical protein
MKSTANIMSFPFGIMGALAMALLNLPGAVAAHTLEAPAAVLSDGDGHFSFEGVFTAGPGDAIFGYWTIDGSDNTDFGIIIADGFCIGTIEEGQVDILPVEANLVDLEENGSISIEYYICEDQIYFTETLILSPVVGVEKKTWGIIKALYR